MPVGGRSGAVATRSGKTKALSEGRLQGDPRGADNCQSCPIEKMGRKEVVEAFAYRMMPLLV